jgi:hypothetical protein
MPNPELLREWHPLNHTLAPDYIPPGMDRMSVSDWPKRFARFGICR